MYVSAINCKCSKPQYFTSDKNGYENPINRKSERNLAIWANMGAGTLIGGSAAGVASLFIEKGTKHRALKLSGIGVAAALAFLALTLPAKIYNTKVNAFAKEKEMDVFSRDKDLKSNIMEEVNKEVQDEDVSLDDKINHYTSVQMANNGNGVLIKGA